MSTEETMISENWVQWKSALSDTTCITCNKLHGKSLPKNDTHLEPPIHPNCKCELTDVIAKVAGTATNNREEGADWYLVNQSELPDYYITKEIAAELGWNSKLGNLSKISPNTMIGGNIFYNTKGLLPSAPDRIWYEADINYTGGYRNLERILYSNDGLIFVTYDHFTTFIEIINIENDELEQENENE